MGCTFLTPGRAERQLNVAPVRSALRARCSDGRRALPSRVRSVRAGGVLGWGSRAREDRSVATVLRGDPRVPSRRPARHARSLCARTRPYPRTPPPRMSADARRETERCLAPGRRGARPGRVCRYASALVRAGAGVGGARIKSERACRTPRRTHGSPRSTVATERSSRAADPRGRARTSARCIPAHAELSARRALGHGEG